MNIYMYSKYYVCTCMYVYYTCVEPIRYANGMEKVSFARIVDAEDSIIYYVRYYIEEKE